jgi:outer membrane protein OmpA-like peptidoglycan-associated protein
MIDTMPLSVVRFSRYFQTLYSASLIIACFALCSLEGFAQNISRTPSQNTSQPAFAPFRVGLYGHAAWNQHESQFLGVQGADYPDPRYITRLENMSLRENPTGNPLQWNAGAIAEWLPLELAEGSSLGASLRLGLNSFSASFSSVWQFQGFASPTPNTALNLTFSAQSLLLHAEPLIQWRFLNHQAALMLGARGAWILNESTTQIGRITAPEVLDENTRRASEPLDFVGTLGGGVIMPSVVLGASWDIPLSPPNSPNGAFILAPEVFYSIVLGNVSNNLRAQTGQTPFWNMSTLRAGIALKFAPAKRVDTDDTPNPNPNLQPDVPATAQNTANPPRTETSVPTPTTTPTTTPPPAQTPPAPPTAEKPLSVRLLAVEGLERDGRRIDNPTLKVEEFIGSSSRYLLPFVFFDKQSSIIPERYTRFRAEDVAPTRTDFSPETLIQATFQDNHELDAYYNILNIIGYRMRKYETARLTLVGYNDAGAETNNKTLAPNRAESVKEYLRSVWGIAANRITTRSAGTHGTTSELDVEENRAVEVQSSMPEILEELRFDYTFRTTDPPKIDFTPEITAPNGIRAWSLAVEGRGIFQAEQHKKTQQEPLRLADFSGKLAPATVTWGAERSLAKLSQMSPDPLRITLRAADSLGQSGEATRKIPVELLTIEEKRRRNAPDVRIGTYWVFCFDLNSKQILVDERVRRAVKAIKTHITPGASVEISGYADTRGDVKKNRKLSDERAESVLQVLNVPSSKIASVEGRGESTLYENELPEGRMYNRFVRVDVRTPIERTNK